MAPSALCHPGGSSLAFPSQTLPGGRCTLRARLQLAQTQLPPETAILFRPHLPLAIPHGCHMDAFHCQLVGSNPNHYCGTVVVTHYSGMAGKRNEAGYGHSLLLSGKQGGIRKRKCTQRGILKVIWFSPSRRKGKVRRRCGSHDCLSNHAATLAES